MARSSGGAAAGGGAIYGLGIFGAWVYFWQQANTFWAVRARAVPRPVLACLDGLLSALRRSTPEGPADRLNRCSRFREWVRSACATGTQLSSITEGSMRRCEYTQRLLDRVHTPGGSILDIGASEPGRGRCMPAVAVESDALGFGCDVPGSTGQ